MITCKPSQWFGLKLILKEGGKSLFAILGGFWNDTKTLVGWISDGVLNPFTRLQRQINLAY